MAPAAGTVGSVQLRVREFNHDVATVGESWLGEVCAVLVRLAKGSGRGELILGAGPGQGDCPQAAASRPLSMSPLRRGEGRGGWNVDLAQHQLSVRFLSSRHGHDIAGCDGGAGLHAGSHAGLGLGGELDQRWSNTVDLPPQRDNGSDSQGG